MENYSFQHESWFKVNWEKEKLPSNSLSSVSVHGWWSHQAEGPHLSWGCRRSLCPHRPDTGRPPGESRTGAVAHRRPGSPATKPSLRRAGRRSGARALPCWKRAEHKSTFTLASQSLSSQPNLQPALTCTGREEEVTLRCRAGAAGLCEAEPRAFSPFILHQHHLDTPPAISPTLWGLVCDYGLWGLCKPLIWFIKPEVKDLV